MRRHIGKPSKWDRRSREKETMMATTKKKIEKNGAKAVSGHADVGAPSTALTTEERLALGRAARAKTPREALSELRLSPDRPDPIAILEKQAETRLQELLPIRYGRMQASPFAFYRGAAAIMATDL